MEEMKKTYEVELAKVREEFIKEKAEKEHFRVRNELLSNMSKIIVEKCLNPSTNEKVVKSNDEKSDNPEDDDITTFINKMKQNKGSGYRRVSPAEVAEKQREEGRRTNGNETTNARSATKKATTEAESDVDEDYCHFYNNYSKCLFEENTGRKCKYAHKKAPICSYDGNCERSKCMFQHREQSGKRSDFLGSRKANFQPPNQFNFNPWFSPFRRGGPPMPNPWMEQGKRYGNN